MTAFLIVMSVLMSMRALSRLLCLWGCVYPRKRSDYNPSDDAITMFFSLGMAVWGWWLVFGGNP